MVLSDVSIRRPVFTIILMAVLVLFGVVGLRALGLDLMPKIEAPFVSVTVIYPGADPDVVENRVLEVLEDACSTISGVKKLTSSAVESYGMMFIEFELSVNADRAVQDVRDQISKVLIDLPQEAETPVIQKIDIGAAPVVALVLTGPPGAPAAELTYVADKTVRAQIQRMNGVGVVNILGKQEREIHIEADPQKLRAYGLSLAEVQQAVAYGNMDVPGGRLTVAGQELLLKTHGEAETLEELRDLVLVNPMGSGPIRLRDVAEVLDTTEEARTLAALDGQKALTLYVLKQSDANSVAVADAVMLAVREKKIDLPKGYGLQTIQTTSDFTRRSVSSVLDDLLLGGALAILVILLFLRNLRATFISALALPTSVVATFAFMRLFGFTLNNITLLALSLSIGMLIDDAIVVIENIHRHIELGKPPRQAAAEATGEIGLAVLATTLTIVVVFVPVALMKGIVGRFFFEFGITVAAAVLISLFVSFTLTPMGASRLLTKHEPGALAGFVGRGLDVLDRAYRAIVGWVLHHRLAVVAMGFLMLGVAFYLVRFIPMEFMPKMDQGELDVTYNLPE
ncbi:MAG TPA: efflux RND transporter permease subunit, partial [Myxococcota bacterium]|nr:efflux RND transporter permease subunit [Myxococcota bacterium]